MVNSSHCLLRVAAAVQTSASCSPSPPQRLVLVFQEQRLQLRKLRSAAKVPQPVSSKTGALLQHHVTPPPAAFVASSPAHRLPQAPCHSACVGSGGGGPPFPSSPRPLLSIEYRFHPWPHNVLPPPSPQSSGGQHLFAERIAPRFCHDLGGLRMGFGVFHGQVLLLRELALQSPDFTHLLTKDRAT